MREQIINTVREKKIIVIARGIEKKMLIPLAEALYEGGIRLLETTYSPDGKISDEETFLLTGENDYVAAADKLIADGVKIAVITLGKNGAYVRTKDFSFKSDGFSVNAVDCTGAGDAFWGGFLTKLCKSGKDIESLTYDELYSFTRYANAVASICVERSGAIPSLPDNIEAEKRVCQSK